jgi:hypothetical protein
MIVGFTVVGSTVVGFTVVGIYGLRQVPYSVFTVWNSLDPYSVFTVWDKFCIPYLWFGTSSAFRIPYPYSLFTTCIYDL